MNDQLARASQPAKVDTWWQLCEYENGQECVSNNGSE